MSRASRLTEKSRRTREKALNSVRRREKPHGAIRDLGEAPGQSSERLREASPAIGDLRALAEGERPRPN